MTASAWTISGWLARPTMSRQPSAVRASSRTMLRVRTVAPDRPPPPGAACPGRGQRGEHGAGAGPVRRRRREQRARRPAPATGTAGPPRRAPATWRAATVLRCGPRRRRRAAGRPAGPPAPGRTAPTRAGRPARHRPGGWQAARHPVWPGSARLRTALRIGPARRSPTALPSTAGRAGHGARRGSGSARTWYQGSPAGRRARPRGSGRCPRDAGPAAPPRPRRRAPRPARTPPACRPAGANPRRR